MLSSGFSADVNKAMPMAALKGCLAQWCDVFNVHGYSGVQGTAEDISRQTNEILRLRQKVNEIMSFHTGKTIEQILKDTDRDYFMSAEEAKDYGLVDEVIISARDKK